VLNVALKEAELKKLVSETYINLVALKQKEQLLVLVRSDSIFAAFLNKATLRFDKGESNILEKITAETQRGNIKLQLKQLQQESALLQSQFQLLLNTENLLTPEINAVVMVNNLAETDVIEHPLLKIKAQQQEVGQALTSVEKAKLLPDISLGFYSTTIKGVGPNEVYYSGTTRFNSGQVGLNIPIFASAQKAKIKAAKIYETELANAYAVEKQQLVQQYKAAYAAYENSRDVVTFLKQTALSNAQKITATADKQFINGDINYLDWVVLTNQSISILDQYINATKTLNENAIQLNYLTTKN